MITEDGEETEPAKPAADHAVTFIGWDDAKETQEGMGAFLAINSWGEDWGENGLFWISYNDASLSDPAAYVMEAREPGVMRDDTVYSREPAIRRRPRARRRPAEPMSLRRKKRRSSTEWGFIFRPMPPTPRGF